MINPDDFLEKVNSINSLCKYNTEDGPTTPIRAIAATKKSLIVSRGSYLSFVGETGMGESHICCSNITPMLFSGSPPSSIFLELNFKKFFKLPQLKKHFYYYRKLTSIGMVFRLNKTFVTHLDCGYVEK